MNPIISLVLAVGMVSVPVQNPVPTQTIGATVYAYSSTVGQTDASPFVTASGERVRDGIIANNCLPFGTIVKFGDKQFVVADRMATRYGCTSFDIWFSSTTAARQFGKQTGTVLVF
ncbi:MAG: hypothetical protein ACD_41C00081G0001 [uncultured bacterium]|nr:MAG: hypothetical protein ACD_41C00081G0001 [uncultured bacterium]HBY73257.1 hypothetical protein [Candidatus Kerfeldbacteria bacterium]